MRHAILLFGLFLAMAGSVSAQKSEIYKTSDGAIKGYDAVAYFKDGKPVKGDPRFAYSWKGANWLFANQQDLDLFKASPEKYAPQYGGYCAYGTADGHKAPIDPQAWTVVNGKLYLNYSPDIKSKWVKDEMGYIKKADQNWPGIKDKE